MTWFLVDGGGCVHGRRSEIPHSNNNPAVAPPPSARWAGRLWKCDWCAAIGVSVGPRPLANDPRLLSDSLAGSRLLSQSDLFMRKQGKKDKKKMKGGFAGVFPEEAGGGLIFSFPGTAPLGKSRR